MQCGFLSRIRETVDGEKVEGIPVEPAETSAALKDQDFLQKSQSGKIKIDLLHFRRASAVAHFQSTTWRVIHLINLQPRERALDSLPQSP